MVTMMTMFVALVANAMATRQPIYISIALSPCQVPVLTRVTKAASFRELRHMPGLSIIPCTIASIAELIELS